MDIPPSLCPRLDAPIVLAHGLFGFEPIELGPLTLASYFRGIPEFIEAAGNRILVSGVPSIGGIERRSGVLARRIRSAFGGEPVHVLGHSMGGLDARALLASEGDSGLILSLTTIATPHLGTALADSARVGLAPFYRLFSTLRIDHEGFLNITQEAAREFHHSHPAPLGVPCFSVAGDPQPHEVGRPLKMWYRRLRELEGPNDGLVSVASANAFGEPLPTWPSDHLHQMGWRASRPGRSVLSLYVNVLENLASIGFAASSRRECMSV